MSPSFFASGAHEPDQEDTDTSEACEEANEHRKETPRVSESVPGASVNPLPAPSGEELHAGGDGVFVADGGDGAFRRFYTDYHIRTVKRVGNATRATDENVKSLWAGLGDEERRKYLDVGRGEAEEGGVKDCSNVRRDADGQGALSPVRGLLRCEDDRDIAAEHDSQAQLLQVAADEGSVRPCDPMYPIFASPAPARPDPQLECPRLLACRICSGKITAPRLRCRLSASDELQLFAPPLRPTSRKGKRRNLDAVCFSKAGRELGRLISSSFSNELAPALRSGLVYATGTVVYVPSQITLYVQVDLEISVYLNVEAMNSHGACVEMKESGAEVMGMEYLYIVHMITRLKFCEPPAEKVEKVGDCFEKGMDIWPGADEMRAKQRRDVKAERKNHGQFELPQNLEASLDSNQIARIRQMVELENCYSTGLDAQNFEDGSIDPRWIKRVFPDGGVFYINSASGAICTGAPSTAWGATRGGLLEDNTGLEKVLFCITCVVHDLEDMLEMAKCVKPMALGAEHGEGTGTEITGQHNDSDGDGYTAEKVEDTPCRSASPRKRRRSNSPTLQTVDDDIHRQGGPHEHEDSISLDGEGCNFETPDEEVEEAVSDLFIFRDQDEEVGESHPDIIGLERGVLPPSGVPDCQDGTSISSESEEESPFSHQGVRAFRSPPSDIESMRHSESSVSDQDKIPVSRSGTCASGVLPESCEANGHEENAEKFGDGEETVSGGDLEMAAVSTQDRRRNKRKSRKPTRLPKWMPEHTGQRFEVCGDRDGVAGENAEHDDVWRYVVSKPPVADDVERDENENTSSDSDERDKRRRRRKRRRVEEVLDDTDEEQEQEAATELLCRSGIVSASAGGTLIVCNLTHISDWITDISRVTSENFLRVKSYHGSNRGNESTISWENADIVITTYKILSSEFRLPAMKKDEKRVRPVSLGPVFNVQWRRVILDEAHTIHSRTSKCARAAWAIPCERRWCLTGAPVHQCLRDMYSMVKFLKIEPWTEWEFWNREIMVGAESNNTVLKQRSVTMVENVLAPVLVQCDSGVGEGYNERLSRLAKNYW